MKMELPTIYENTELDTSDPIVDMDITTTDIPSKPLSNYNGLANYVWAYYGKGGKESVAVTPPMPPAYKARDTVPPKDATDTVPPKDATDPDSTLGLILRTVLDLFKLFFVFLLIVMPVIEIYVAVSPLVIIRYMGPRVCVVEQCSTVKYLALVLIVPACLSLTQWFIRRLVKELWGWDSHYSESLCYLAAKLAVVSGVLFTLVSLRVGIHDLVYATLMGLISTIIVVSVISSTTYRQLITGWVGCAGITTVLIYTLLLKDTYIISYTPTICYTACVLLVFVVIIYGLHSVSAPSRSTNIKLPIEVLLLCAELLMMAVIQWAMFIF